MLCYSVKELLDGEAWKKESNGDWKRKGGGGGTDAGGGFVRKKMGRR